MASTSYTSPTSGLGESNSSTGYWCSNEHGPVWIPDSGATSHMTNDSTILTAQEDFTGDEQVMVGD
ncbi:hypothetical protein MKX03_007116, partial [Papaver bracteatum]